MPDVHGMFAAGHWPQITGHNYWKGTVNRMSESRHENRSGGLTAVDDFTGAGEGGLGAVVRDD